MPLMLDDDHPPALGDPGEKARPKGRKSKKGTKKRGKAKRGEEEKLPEEEEGPTPLTALAVAGILKEQSMPRLTFYYSHQGGESPELTDGQKLRLQEAANAQLSRSGDPDTFDYFL